MRDSVGRFFRLSFVFFYFIFDNREWLGSVGRGEGRVWEEEGWDGCGLREEFWLFSVSRYICFFFCVSFVGWEIRRRRVRVVFEA